MANIKQSLTLRRVFLHLLVVHLFVPLALFNLLIITGLAFSGVQNLISKQSQVIQSMANKINDHLDNSGRVLDAVAKVAEISDEKNLSNFMKSTFEAYIYFDTIYYLDQDNSIKLLYPYDVRYIGLDMSRLPDFQNNSDPDNIFISNPFISLRTGEPTVYLVETLSNGGRIVGELNLGLFQEDIAKVTEGSSNNSVFVMDANGTLLAHTSSELVQQQVNMSNLKIFGLDQVTNHSMIYDYFGKSVLGTAGYVEKTGWIVVDQTEIFPYLSSYAWILGLAFITLMLICITLSWNLQKRLQRYVAAPLEQLSKIVNELTEDSNNQINYFPLKTESFEELNKFACDFQNMRNTLQIRKAALKESEERYRGLFDRVPIGLFRASIEYEILDINPAGVSIFGYADKQKLLEVKFTDLIYRPLVGGDDESEGSKLNINNLELQMMHKNGSVIWVKISAHIVDDGADKVRYYEGSIEDISERKNSEKALEQAKNELELQVEQRTQQLVALNEELLQLSSLDGLTGINNRRYFDQFLEQNWSLSMRQRIPLAIIILDIDFFKYYNDYYGHQAGDECLKQISFELKNVLKRSSDLVARYGGEEFVVVLPNTDIDVASIMAEDIRQKIENLRIEHKKSLINKYVTVSIGVASVIPKEGSSSSEIITIADNSLYIAKREGRNRICVSRNFV